MIDRKVVTQVRPGKAGEDSSSAGCGRMGTRALGLAILWAFLGAAVPAQGWRISTLDAAGDVDAWVDLTLDADRWPHLCAQNRC